MFIPDDVALVSAHPFKGAYLRNRAKNKPEEEMPEVVKKLRMLQKQAKVTDRFIDKYKGNNVNFKNQLSELRNGCQIEYFSYLYNDSGYGSSISHTKQLIDFDEIIDLYQLDHKTNGFREKVNIDVDPLILEDEVDYA